ncbi:hypothetical protein [Streptomyces albidochromogenes]|uniref:hypothetical protein n=1 Tax=Streptomyces albidochromogenes TaxID=329524 RepID=UPI00110FDF72|nr:hypothetical protein [Streptomyces albidochromogenes]
MPEAPQVEHASAAVNAEELRKRLTSRVVRRFLAYGATFAVMAAVPPLLVQSGAFDGTWHWLVYVTAPFTGIGILGLLAVLLYKLPPAVVVTRACRKALRQYSFEEFWPQVVKKDGKQATRGRPELTLRLKNADGTRSPLLRVLEVPSRGRRRDPWPEGIENGVWVAGDLPFGAIAFVPGSGALLLLHPEKWDRLASERESAGRDRIARAERAGLARRVF